MIVVATDAPLSIATSSASLRAPCPGSRAPGPTARMASGDYVIAFSTADQVRRRVVLAPPGDAPQPPAPRATADLSNDDMSPLFEGVIEATEEAIYDSMFMATTVTSNGHTVEAIPLDKVRAILAKYGVAHR